MYPRFIKVEEIFSMIFYLNLEGFSILYMVSHFLVECSWIIIVHFC